MWRRFTPCASFVMIGTFSSGCSAETKAAARSAIGVLTSHHFVSFVSACVQTSFHSTSASANRALSASALSASAVLRIIGARAAAGARGGWLQLTRSAVAALLLRGSMFENSQQRPNYIAPLLES
jgi:hypothetical protein